MGDRRLLQSSHRTQHHFIIKNYRFSAKKLIYSKRSACAWSFSTSKSPKPRKLKPNKSARDHRKFAKVIYFFVANKFRRKLVIIIFVICIVTMPSVFFRWRRFLFIYGLECDQRIELAFLFFSKFDGSGGQTWVLVRWASLRWSGDRSLEKEFINVSIEWAHGLWSTLLTILCLDLMYDDQSGLVSGQILKVSVTEDL